MVFMANTNQNEPTEENINISEEQEKDLPTLPPEDEEEEEL